MKNANEKWELFELCQPIIWHVRVWIEFDNYSNIFYFKLVSCDGTITRNRWNLNFMLFKCQWMSSCTQSSCFFLLLISLFRYFSAKYKTKWLKLSLAKVFFDQIAKFDETKVEKFFEHVAKSHQLCHEPPGTFPKIIGAEIKQSIRIEIDINVVVFLVSIAMV